MYVSTFVGGVVDAATGERCVTDARQIEIHAGSDLPEFTLLGVDRQRTRETGERLRAALDSSGISWPFRRIVVDGLEGETRYADLAIAAGILAATGELDPRVVERSAFIGDLGLDGGVRGHLGHRPGRVPLDVTGGGSLYIPGVLRPLGGLDCVDDVVIRPMSHLVGVLSSLHRIEMYSGYLVD